MKKFITKVISNSLVGENLYEMRFAMDTSAGVPQPGQFCTIRVSESSSPLLRRPFAFSNFDYENNTTSVVFKKCGQATEILAGKYSGDPLDVIAPLGNSFLNFAQGKTNILVAGGTGFGPIFFLNKILRSQKSPSIVVLGCRSKAQLPVHPLPGQENAIWCTEDASAGFKGTVIDYLKSLPINTFDKAVFFCCGPSPMLKACNDFSLDKKLDCNVSLEQVMACGVGACMGCVVKVKGENQYARVCTEGPVFSSKTILWT